MSSNTNLGNTPVNQGYVQLIHTGETAGITTTLKALYDGDGTASDLLIASNSVKVSTPTNFYIGSKTITEYVQDVVGDMFDTNGSHTNITATYDDNGDGAIDLVATGAISGITGGTGIDATGSGNITIAIDSTVATLTGTQTLSNKTLASPTFTGTANGANLTLTGDLTVSGDTIFTNSNTVLIGDAILTLNADETGSPTANAGFEVERGTSTNKTFIWNETDDKWTIGSETFVAGTVEASLTGNVTGNVTGSASLNLLKSSNLSDLANVATARTNLGVDAAGTDNSTNVTLAGSLDYITASGTNNQTLTRNAINLGTDVTSQLPIANGGTGATNVTTARENLGLEIGLDVQAFDAGLLSIASLTTSANKMIYTTASDTYAVTSLTSSARDLLADGVNFRSNFRLSTDASNDADSASDSGIYRIDSGYSNLPSMNYGTLVTFNNKSDTGFQIAADYHANGGSLQWRAGNSSTFNGVGSNTSWFKIWNEDNDGANSGLDADLLDGVQGSSFVQTSRSITPVSLRGISGGGDLSADRTLELSASQLAAATLSTSDKLILFDADNSDIPKKFTAQDIFDTISGAVTVYSNTGNDRVLTSGGGTTINGESNLTFDGDFKVAGTLSTLETVNFDQASGDTAVIISGTGNQRLEFRDTATGANAWIGIPSWNDDAFYLFGPTATSNEHAYTYESSTHRFYTGSSEQLAIFSNGAIDMSGYSVADRHLEIGSNRQANGYAYIDLIGDTTYTDFGARFIRENGGPNTGTAIEHRGTGVLSLNAKDAGSVRFYTSNTERVRVDSSGNVSIGNISASRPLQIGFTTTNGEAIKLDGNASYGASIYYSRGGGYNWNAGVGGASSSSSNIPASYWGVEDVSQGNAVRLAIAHTTGNVGIGVTSPGSALEVNGVIESNTSDGLGYFRLDVSGTNKAIVGLEPAVGGGSANDLSIYSRTGNLRFWANGGQKAIIDTSGNVGIGTNSPNTLMHLYSTSNTQLRLQTTGTANASSIIYQNGTASYTVGINSAEWFSFYSSQLGADAGYINTNGNLHWNHHLLFNANHKFIYAKDTNGTNTRILGLNSGNTTYIGPIDAYAGGSVIYGVSSNVLAHYFYTDGAIRMKLDGPVLDLPNTGDWSSILNNTNSGGLRFGSKDAGGTLAYQIELSNTGNYVKLNENTTITGNVNATGVYQLDGTTIINSDGNFEVHDTRAVTPSTDIGLKGVRFDFKNNSADGLSDGGTYHGVMTFQQWNDTSGGHIHALGFTDNGYVHHRNASISGTFGNWKKLIQEDESGNVGIGVASPGYKLDVVGTSRTDALIIDGGGTYAAGSIYSDSNWGMLFRAKQASPSQAEFRWANSADSELMRIDSSGNLKLPSDNQKLIIGANSDLELYAHDPAGDSRINVNNNPLLITYNGVDRFRMNSTALIINEGGGDYNFKVEGDTDASLFFVDAGTDRVGIGTASPAQKLHVVGNGYFTADVVAYYSSDKRLKDNIKTIKNAVDKVSKIRGVEFDWNDKQGTYQGHDIGVVAQEVEKVLPEITTTRDDGYKAVKYEKIVPLLIEAIKEQQEQINELKEKLNG